MIGDYPVYFASQHTGTVTVTQEGMFWRIQCHCKTSADVPCILQASWGEETLDLGLLVKSEAGLTLVTRLNRKKTPQGRPVFRMLVKHRQSAESFVPISPEDPFAYLSKLKDAYLVRQGDKLGIGWKNQSDSVSPTGQ